MDDICTKHLKLKLFEIYAYLTNLKSCNYQALGEG